MLYNYVDNECGYLAEKIILQFIHIFTYQLDMEQLIIIVITEILIFATWWNLTHTVSAAFIDC